MDSWHDVWTCNDTMQEEIECDVQADLAQAIADKEKEIEKTNSFEDGPIKTDRPYLLVK